jgi:hypothetical protein
VRIEPRIAPGNAATLEDVDEESASTFVEEGAGDGAASRYQFGLDTMSRSSSMRRSPSRPTRCTRLNPSS